MPTAGNDLKVERVRANLKAREVAAQMGLSRQAVWGLERAAEVDPERAQEYLAAVETLRDAKLTSQVAVPA